MTEAACLSSPFYSSLIERALRFAAVAHRDHHRKGGTVPYVTHLAGTALVLARAGFTEEPLLAAALLHDVVEDTAITVEELTGTFPAAVVSLVSTLSEVKRDVAGQPLSWEIRKSEHLERLRRAPRDARAIALADRLHNLGTLVDDLAVDPGAWSRFSRPVSLLLAHHAYAIDAAAGDDADLVPLANACRDLLSQLLNCTVLP